MHVQLKSAWGHFHLNLKDEDFAGIIKLKLMQEIRVENMLFG